MEKIDTQRFSNALGTLCEVMGKELSPLAIGAYFKILERYTMEQVETAISAAMTECEWFPKPAELIRFITGGAQHIGDTAMLQTNIAIKAAKQVGHYQSVKFDDPVTGAVINECFGGWVRFCTDLTENNEVWVRKDFEKSYLIYCRNNMTYDGHLPGTHEIENGNAGYSEHTDKPILISNAKPNLQLSYNAEL